MYVMSTSTYGNKWYIGGLHFECMQCGRCCSGPGEGYIWISRKEIEFVADHLKLTVGELRRRYTKRIGLRTTIIEDPVSRDCVFLEKDSGQRACTIYPVRPNQCRTWPFWSSNLESPYNWNGTAQKCPGINRGRGYSIEQVERIRKSRKWW
jgi:Fe-S-cluster containining protein